MPTNLALDDRKIDEARRLGAHKTKREAVDAALDAYIQQLKRHGLLAMEGRVEYRPGYDYKALRKLRPKRP